MKTWQLVSMVSGAVMFVAMFSYADITWGPQSAVVTLLAALGGWQFGAGLAQGFLEKGDSE